MADEIDVSGGVNFKRGKVVVSGEIVGRDKIVNQGADDALDPVKQKLLARAREAELELLEQQARTQAKVNAMTSESSHTNISDQEGGINFGDGAQVSGGNLVGRDNVGTMSSSTGGATPDQYAKLFEPLLDAVKQQVPSDKLAEAEQKIADLQEQIKAKTPNIGIVGTALKWVKKNVPGASEVLKTVLNQPIVGQAVKDLAAVILED